MNAEEKRATHRKRKSVAIFRTAESPKEDEKGRIHKNVIAVGSSQTYNRINTSKIAEKKIRQIKTGRIPERGNIIRKKRVNRRYGG